MKYTLVLLIVILAFCESTKAQILSNEELIDSIDILLKEKGIPAGIISVVTKDSILFHAALGYANTKSKIKVKETDLFKIASLTKTFTVMAIMRLVKDGKLSLEDELKLIAPEIPFVNKWEDTSPIRIKHLIEHTSGFSDYRFADLAGRYDQNINMNSFDQVVSLKPTLKSNWEPGLVTSYSNPGYTVLGYIIEKVSGELYKNYVRDKILIPLGMLSSGFLNHVDVEQDLIVNGYKEIDDIIFKSQQKEIAIGLGATGLVSNIADMSNFLQFFLNVDSQENNSIIGVEAVNAMEKMHSGFNVSNKVKMGYNLTLEDRIIGDSKHLFKGNSGLTDGFVSNFIYSRDLDIGIFVSTNLFQKSNISIVNLLVNNFCTTNEVGSDFEIRYSELSRFSDWVGEHRELNDTQEIWNFINFPFRTKNVKIVGSDLIVSDLENGEVVYKNVGGNAFLSKEYGETVPSIYLTEYNGIRSMSYYNSTYVSTNKMAYLTLRIFLFISLILLLTAVLFFLFQILLFPFKGTDRKLLLITFKSILPFFVILTSIYILIDNMEFERILNLGRMCTTSILIFILTLMYPFTCIWFVISYVRSSIISLRGYQSIYWKLLVFSNIFITIYCIYMGWFAVVFWR